MFCIDGLQQSCFTHQCKDLELEDRHCYSYIFLISLSCSFFSNGHYFNGDLVSVASKKKKKSAGVKNMMKVVKLLSILMGFPCVPHTHESFIKKKKKTERKRKKWDCVERWALAEFYSYHEKVRLASSVLNSDELTVTFHYGLYVKLGPGNKPATLQHHLQPIFVPRISCPPMKMDKLHVFYFEQDKVRNFLESGYDDDPGWIWSFNTIQC